MFKSVNEKKTIMCRTFFHKSNVVGFFLVFNSALLVNLPLEQARTELIN